MIANYSKWNNVKMRERVMGKKREGEKERERKRDMVLLQIRN